MVLSVDGKITQGDNPDVGLWTSAEDKAHFRRLVEGAKVIVMGRKTYEMAKDQMEHKQGRLRIVVTRSPEKYAQESKEGMLEFMDQLPRYENMLVVGGSEVAAMFLRAKMITRLFLTMEPEVFGAGKTLLARVIENVHLELKSVKKLNKQGTLLIEYGVSYGSNRD